MKTRFEQKLLQKALNRKFSEVEEMIVETAVDEMATQENPKIKLKNICAFVTPQLAERLEATLNTLKMSKREFLTWAIIEALDKADQVIDEVDIYEDEEEGASS